MRWTGTVALLVAALLLAGGGSAAAADKIRVGMLKPNIVSALYWIAVKTGSFEKNGLEIDERPFPSGQSVAAVEQMLRGNLDFYFGAGGEVARADSQAIAAGKPPPVALIQGADPGGSFIVMRNDLKGKTLDDLKDQPLRIGVSSPSSIHLIIFRAFLHDRNMTTDDLKWKFLTIQGGDMVPALVGGQLDGFMHDALTTTIALNAKAGNIFMAARNGDMGPAAKNLASTTISASRAYMAAHPDVTTRFLKALHDASAAYTAGPRAKMVDIMAEWSRQQPSMIEAIYDRFDPRVMLDRKAAEVWWQFNGTAMKARGEIGDKLTFDDVFDLSHEPK